MSDVIFLPTTAIRVVIKVPEFKPFMRDDVIRNPRDVLALPHYAKLDSEPFQDWGCRIIYYDDHRAAHNFIVGDEVIRGACMFVRVIEEHNFIGSPHVIKRAVNMTDYQLSRIFTFFIEDEDYPWRKQNPSAEE